MYMTDYLQMYLQIIRCCSTIEALWIISNQAGEHDHKVLYTAAVIIIKKRQTTYEDILKSKFILTLIVMLIIIYTLFQKLGVGKIFYL